MKRILATALLAIVAYGTSSQALGECPPVVKEIIRDSGGNKEAAIDKTRKSVIFHKNNKSGPFWTSTKNQKEREEMFAALEENANEIIKSIRSCTDSDLASIAPKVEDRQPASEASNCPMEAFDDQGYRKARREGDAIQFYDKYATDNDWHPGYRGMLSDKGLEHLYCVENHSNFDKQLCRMFQCSMNSSTSASSSRAQAQINVGNASEASGRKEGGKSAWKRDSETSRAETCVCGPDYITCHERNLKRGGARYQVFRESGYTSIVNYDKNGMKLTTHVWRGGNNCGAAAH